MPAICLHLNMKNMLRILIYSKPYMDKKSPIIPYPADKRFFVINYAGRRAAEWRTT